MSESRDRTPGEPPQTPPPPPPLSDSGFRERWRPGPIAVSVIVAAILTTFGLSALVCVPILGSLRTSRGLDTPYQHPVEGISAAPNESPAPLPLPTDPASPLPTDPASPSPTSSLTAAFEDLVVAMVNEERSAVGCPTVRSDDQLHTSALDHSADMAARNYFSQKSRDGSTPQDRMRRAGYDQPLNENIAMGHDEAQAVMDIWMHTRNTKARILNCEALAIGVGLAYRGSTPYWTQDFGRQ